ncbi:hypothetical protein ACFE04_024252 [Oxalis oulophora]
MSLSLPLPLPLPLPEAFLNFLEANSLDPSIYSSITSIPRYIRLKHENETHIEELEAELNCKLQRVNWLPAFYSLPPQTQIANSKAYKQGKLYGIDAASGAAVMALDIRAGDHVLDLCAAPGAKLCMIADVLGDSGSVTGVDIAKHRLAACRTMLQKYALGDRCRLFVADGTTFSLGPTRDRSDHVSCESPLEDSTNVYRKWTSRKPWKERKRAAKADKNVSSGTQPPELIFYGQQSGVIGLSRGQVYETMNDKEISAFGYDKVLVDAECTHDGSVKHIQKFEHWGWTTLQRRVLDAERSDRNLTALQLKLLSNGFRMLKVGGSLVYSTCSLTVAQNEDVIHQFLEDNASAELMEIDASNDWPCESGGISKSLRFDPLTSETSGLFVAKLTKLDI